MSGGSRGGKEGGTPGKTLGDGHSCFSCVSVLTWPFLESLLKLLGLCHFSQVTLHVVCKGVSGDVATE